MVLGTLVVGSGLLVLGWVSEIAEFFVADPDAVSEGPLF